MKKIKKTKLSLNAETLRVLDSSENKQVAGGWPSQLTCLGCTGTACATQVGCTDTNGCPSVSPSCYCPTAMPSACGGRC